MSYRYGNSFVYKLMILGVAGAVTQLVSTLFLALSLNLTTVTMVRHFHVTFLSPFEVEGYNVSLTSFLLVLRLVPAVYILFMSAFCLLIYRRYTQGQCAFSPQLHVLTSDRRMLAFLLVEILYPLGSMFYNFITPQFYTNGWSGSAERYILYGTRHTLTTETGQMSYRATYYGHFSIDLTPASQMIFFAVNLLLVNSILAYRAYRDAREDVGLGRTLRNLIDSGYHSYKELAAMCSTTEEEIRLTLEDELISGRLRGRLGPKRFSPVHVDPVKNAPSHRKMTKWESSIQAREHELHERFRKLVRRARRMTVKDFMLVMDIEDRKLLYQWVLTLPEDSVLIDGETVLLSDVEATIRGNQPELVEDRKVEDITAT